ncbi:MULTISPECIES: hypothetical protein [Nocardia]|nr:MULTISPECIES: hypothetical protein [Nocardia]
MPARIRESLNTQLGNILLGSALMGIGILIGIALAVGGSVLL